MAEWGRGRRRRRLKGGGGWGFHWRGASVRGGGGGGGGGLGGGGGGLGGSGGLDERREGLLPAGELLHLLLLGLPRLLRRDHEVFLKFLAHVPPKFS